MGGYTTLPCDASRECISPPPSQGFALWVCPLGQLVDEGCKQSEEAGGEYSLGEARRGGPMAPLT